MHLDEQNSEAVSVMSSFAPHTSRKASMFCRPLSGVAIILSFIFSMDSRFKATITIVMLLYGVLRAITYQAARGTMIEDIIHKISSLKG